MLRIREVDKDIGVKGVIDEKSQSRCLQSTSVVKEVSALVWPRQESKSAKEMKRKR